MLRSGVLARNALRATKRDIAWVTRTVNQLQLQPLPASTATPTSPTSSPTCGQCYAVSLRRAYATATATKTKKPAARKAKTKAVKTTTTTRKKTTKKTAAAKKPVTRRKTKKVAKKKPAPKKKKVLSERQKQLLEKRKSLDALQALKTRALMEPKRKPASQWAIFIAERLSGSSGKATEALKALGPEYKALSLSERETLDRTARLNKASNEADYEAWVKKHTPEEIRLANSARKALQRRLKAAGSKGRTSGLGLSPIKDDRQIKKPATSYLIFASEWRRSGDHSKLGLIESAKAIKGAWSNLGPGEKKKYEDLAEADKQRYVREYTRTYNHRPAMAAAAA